MKRQYLLSDGSVTTDPALYIQDLFPLYLSVNPGDVPYLPDYGFNFTFAGIPKSELYSKVKFRMEALVRLIQDSFQGSSITLDSLEMPSEDTVKAIITVDGVKSDLYINIYENS
jgi:hypothetical protein